MVDYGHNWTQKETEEFIGRCYDRDTLLVTLLNYAKAWLLGRVICVVGQDHVQPFMSRGWSGWGTDEEITEALSRHRISLEEHAILEAIVEQGSHTIGACEELGLQEVFEEANVLQPDELIVVPLQLAGRTKMLLFGEPKQAPRDLVQFSSELEPLVTIAEAISAQLEKIIKLTKAQRMPPPEERVPPPPPRLRGSVARATPSVAVSRARLPGHSSSAEEHLSEPSEASPPRLHPLPQRPAAASRMTQPIQILQKSDEPPQLQELFAEREASGQRGTRSDAHIQANASTHLGTPREAPSVFGRDQPVLDRALLEQLPPTPFEPERSEVEQPVPTLKAPGL